jgi:tetratricopeptide (TPR) repeat protein
MSFPFPMRILFSALILLLSLDLRAEETPDAAYEAANASFEAGKYAEAASAYEKLAADGNVSSELFYNLGTAKYRLDNVGEGVLWMRRALVVEPAMPEVQQNLAFLRSKLAFLEFAGTRLERFIGALPATFAPWAVSLSIWIGLLALALAIFVPRLRPNRSSLFTLAILATMAAFVFYRVGTYRDTRVAVENFATITTSGAKALTAPAPDAKPVIELPPGSEVLILRAAGSWTYVEIPGDLRGWIRSESLRAVWPVSLSQTTP